MLFTIPAPIQMLDEDGNPAKKSRTLMGPQGPVEIFEKDDEPPFTFVKFLEMIFQDAKMAVDENNKPRGRDYMKATTRTRRLLKGKAVGEIVMIESVDHGIILGVMNQPGTGHPMHRWSQFEPFIEAWEAATQATGKEKVVVPAEATVTPIKPLEPTPA